MMFFKTVLLSMKRRKKEIRFLKIATLIVVLFMSSVSLFQNIMDRYVIETNYKSFGEWALASVDQELSHPYFSLTGDCYTGMSIVDEEGNTLAGSLGYLDDNFLKIANISFYEGRLPEKENEIAMTLSALASMNLNFDLGQEITMQVLEGEAVKEATFTLVGTFRDFATGWTTLENYPLPSCLVTKEALLGNGGIAYTTHFYQLDRKYEGIDMKEFRTPYLEGDAAETTVFNQGAYENRLWGSDDMLQNVQRILVVIAVLVISYLMLSYVTKRRKWYYQLRSTGASKVQIWLMILIEGGYGTIPWAILGIALPYLIAIPVCLKISEKMQIPNIFVMDWQNLIMQIIAVFGIILVAIIASCISSREKRLSHNIHEVTQGQIEELRRVANKEKNVAKAFIKRQNILSQGQGVMMTLLTMIVSGIMVLCVLMIYKQYDWYQMFAARPDVCAEMYEEEVYTYTEITPENESIEMEVSTFYQDMYTGLDENMETQLEVMEGIESIEKVMQTGDHYLEWDGKENSEIIQLYTKMKKEQGVAEEDLEMVVNRACNMKMVFEEYETLYEKYGTCFEEAGVKADALQRGEQIFVIVTERTEDVFTDDTYTEFETLIYEEKTLNAGDMVRVKAFHSVCDYEVEAAVVHMTREEYDEAFNKEGSTFGEYMLFATFEFAEKLAKEAGQSEIKYNKVDITFDRNASYNSTMKKVAEFMEKYGFSYRSDWERKQTEQNTFIRYCCVYGTMFVVVLSVYLILMMNLNQMKNYERARKYRMLKRLGMSDSFFQQMIIKQGIREALWILTGIPVGYFMFGWVLQAQEIQISGSVSVDSTFIKKYTTSFFWVIMEYIYENREFKCFLIIAVILVGAMLAAIGIVSWSARKSIKEGKVS